MKELDWIHDGETKLNPESKFDLIKFKEYVNTYTKTGAGGGCDDDRIIVKDMLYGIGLCLNEKEYENADGYRKFIAFLRGKIL